MQFPINLRFKVFGLAPQIFVEDAKGNSVFYVKQKLFKLKEAVKVFRDSSQKETLFEINADRVIDFSAKYNIKSTQGMALGAVKRKGMKSLFRAHYEIYDGETQLATIREEAVWKRIVERFLAEIPVIGLLAVYLINPTYLLSRSDGTVTMKLIKKPSWVGRKFEITKEAEQDDEEMQRNLLSLMMMVLLERSRG